MNRLFIVVTHLLGAGHLTGFAHSDADGIETEQRLAAAVRRALERPRHPPVPIRLDGAGRTVAIVEDRLQRSAR